MDIAQNIAQRFIALPLEKRRLYLEKMLAQGISPANFPIPAVRDSFDTLPVSYAQERQWFLWQMDPNNSTYNISTALLLHGKLDVLALTRSFDALVERHESLRTTFSSHTFNSHTTGVQQIVHAHALVNITTHVLEACSDEDDCQYQIAAFVDRESQQSFDLQKGPLLRVGLLRMDNNRHVLTVVVHHIIADGWSMTRMVNELMQLYAAITQHTEAELPALPIQYADYAIWQRSWMDAGERDRQLAYWQTVLGGEQPILGLPADRPRPPQSSYRGARIHCEMPSTLSKALLSLASREGVTPFVLLLTAFHVLLHRYSGQADIRIGVPVANRNRVEIESLLGLFVNTQVFKADIDSEMRFSDLLNQVKRTAMDAQVFQELPFEQLVEALQPRRSLNLNPLFQAMFNFQIESGAQLSLAQLPGLRVETLTVETHTSAIDLTLDVFETAVGLSAAFTYATDLFDASTIECMARHWLNLLKAIISEPQQRIVELSLLESHERRLIAEKCNGPAVLLTERCVHELIEMQTEKTPDAVALIFDDRSLTYAELNIQANRLAHRLIELGVRTDTRVGIAIDRSFEMIIGLLAILKAGGAYVPLDPDYPAERLTYMMEDSGIALLLTKTSSSQTPLINKLPIPAHINSLSISLDDAETAQYSASNPPHNLNGLRRSRGDNLCYLIYTSGSTGKPKGVMVRHSALSNFIASMAKIPGISAADKLLSLTTFSFDIFGLEIYLPLTTGSCVVLASKEVSQDPLRALQLVKREQITVLQATPSIWRILLESEQAAVLSNCRFFCGGEALDEELAARMRQIGVSVWNLYGPTETTIWSALQCIDVEARLALGRPIDNTGLYVVESNLSIALARIAGELLIGGEGLARGYHRRPALTAERFVPNPFSNRGERLYRTGDLASYHTDGAIDYLGRIDQQVKIHGFRIELGEIETRIKEDTAVRDASVITQASVHGPQLVAYIVAKDSIAVTDAAVQDALRNQLKNRLKICLPNYMVPAHILFIAQFPLTPNGKLDRKALPALDTQSAKKDFVAPASELQRSVAAIWQDLLKSESIGLADNFFELGGHSLLAAQVAHRLREQLQLDISIKSLFIAENLGEFCEMVQAAQPEARSVEDALTKSLEALKRLSASDIENLIS